MTGRSRVLAAGAATVAFVGIFGMLVWDPPVELGFRLMAFGSLLVLSEVKLAAREKNPRFRPAQVHAIRSFNRVVFGSLLALLVAVPLIITLATEWGVISEPSLFAERRVMLFAVGLLIASIGNHMPKLISPFQPREEPFDWQAGRRMVGWVVCLSGVALVCAAFLPWPAAKVLVIGALVPQLGAILVFIAQRMRLPNRSVR